MKSRDEILARIRKILSKSEANGATEHEASLAVEMAQRIALEYGLGLDDLQLEETDENVINESHLIEAFNIIDWKLTLIKALVFANGCSGFWKHLEYKTNARRVTTKRTYTVVGTEPARVAVTESYFYLESVVEMLAVEELEDVKRRIRIKELWMPDGLVPKDFIKAFRVGCAERLAERLREGTKALEEKGTEKCTAIVVANFLLESRKKAKEWRDKKYSILTEKRITRNDRSDTLGFNLGKEAADTVELTPKRQLQAK